MSHLECTRRGAGREPVPPVEEPRRGRREARHRSPRLPPRTRHLFCPGRFLGPGGGRRAAGADGEVRRAGEAQPCHGPRSAGRRAGPAGDRPPPGLGTAHRPTLRPSRPLRLAATERPVALASRRGSGYRHWPFRWVSAAKLHKPSPPKPVPKPQKTTLKPRRWIEPESGRCQATTHAYPVPPSLGPRRWAAW